MNDAAERRPWQLYSSRRRWAVLLILFLAGTSNYADRSVIGVLLEPIKAEFGVADAMLGLLSGLAFALFYAALGLPIARWADRGDRKVIITVALSVWSVMTALCGFAQSFWQLALTRVGVGIGEAGGIPPAHSLIADYFAPDRRSKALGIFMFCATFGGLLGTVVGGWAAQRYGWRAAFLILGMPGLVVALLARLFLDEPRRRAGFVVDAGQQEAPLATCRALLDKAAFRDILISMVLYFSMTYGALGFTAPFMIRVHGFDVAEVGAAVGIIVALGGIVGNFGGGALSDYLCKRDVAWLARLPGWAVIVALPLHELAFVTNDQAVMIAALMLGFAMLSGAIPALFAAVHLICGSKRRATAIAIIFFFANLIGLGLGPIVTGALSDLLARSHGSAEGLRWAMMTMLLVLVPCGAFLLRGAARLKTDAEE